MSRDGQDGHPIHSPSSSRYNERVRWLILGCGYTGTRLAARLICQGHQVLATTRSAKRRTEIIQAVEHRSATANSSPPGQLTVILLAEIKSSTLRTLIEAGMTVVDSIPPLSENGSEQQEIAQACVSQRARRLLYLSSTGVYGKGNHQWITEEDVLAPLGQRGLRRVAAERAITATANEGELSWAAMRIAGIYGPGRGVLERMRRGDYQISSPHSWVSRIHVDDLVDAIIAAGLATKLSCPAFNIADDEPTRSRTFADAISKRFGLPRAEIAEGSTESAQAMLAANRRISNAQAKRELGWTLRYPSWREGLEALDF